MGKTLAGFGRAILMEKRKIEQANSQSAANSGTHNRGLLHLRSVTFSNRCKPGGKGEETR